MRTMTKRKETARKAERQEPSSKKKKFTLDREMLFYCLFSAIVIGLLTGAVKMGLIASFIFIMLATMYLYIAWLIYTLLSRIMRFIYRKYIRGYLRGIKQAKIDLEDE